MARTSGVLILSAIVVAGAPQQIRAQTVSAAPTGAEAAATCAPSEGVAPGPGDGLRILGVQDTVPRTLYGLTELVVLSGGSQSGVLLNQEYFIRRPYAFGWRTRPGARSQSIHTVGRVKVVAVNEATAIGQIQSICDGIIAGDFLEPFSPPPTFADTGPATPATLDFSSLGRVKFGDEERRLGSPGDYMLLDAGMTSLTPGARVAVYRDLGVARLPLAAIGEGLIVGVTNGTPVMRITSARDAIQSGDYIVRHK
jgi:hypothetical protein